MALVRIVAVATTNDFKWHECRRMLEPYGIHVLLVHPEEPPDSFFGMKADEFAKRCQKPITSRFRPLYVLREQTALYCTIAEETNPHRLPMLAPCVHVSDLTAVDASGTQTKYQARVEGHIDHTRQHACSNHYDWDDIFVVSGLDKTYLELQEFHHKTSARDQTLSAFIKDKLHYKVPRQLSHDFVQARGGIDHLADPSDFLSNISEYKVKTPILVSNIPKAAMNLGFFFRRAQNRREALYWSPGSNAGLPLIAKPKDPMHEKVFMFHDLTHFCIPDLIAVPHGRPVHQLELERKVYVMYRLLSEAITLVLADMIMVDACERAGYTYDTKLKRKIFPVFELLRHTVKDASDPQTLYLLLWGSAEYCFWQDMTVWRSMMEQGSTEASSAVQSEFQHKYDAYFIEDLNWTIANYKDMSKDAAHRHIWWHEMHQFVPCLYSVEAWIAKFNITEQSPRLLLKQVFDSIFYTYIMPLISEPVVLEDKTQRFKSAFASYMVFQMRLFYKFEGLEPALRARCIVPLHKGLRAFCTTPWKSIQDMHQAATCLRDFYTRALLALSRQMIISNDDASVFAQVYPLFRPKVIDYDHPGTTEPLVASTYFQA